MELSPEAQRVLGALIEKELATPQSYPLSLNALRTATNQTTNRDPVVDFDEETCRAALQELSGLDLVRTVYANRSNTPKHAHLLGDYLEVGPDAVALLAVLMLRGPQTLGELRARTERLHAFAELSDVAASLQALAEHPLQPLAGEVPRQPGQKEGRWQHLLGDQAELDAPASPTGRSTAGGGLAELREELAELRDEVETLQLEVERLRRAVGGS